MKFKVIYPLLVAGMLKLLSAQAAEQHATVTPQGTGGKNESKVNRAAPTLTLITPPAEFLKEGYVYLPFTVKNMNILPLYTEINGEETTRIVPEIGHLHIMVDGNGWSWIHASDSPVYFGPLKKGKHTVRVELVDSSHKIILVKTISVNVP
jgi:Family of unknown function (DUF6130)